jgi:hypothetical protein
MTIKQRYRRIITKRINGAILIEFAVAIPTLFAILYYIHDIPKYKQILLNMEFCGHCAVNIIQNIKQRAPDSEESLSKITIQDLKHITATMWLPHYGAGISQYSTNEDSQEYIMPPGYETTSNLFCMKGTEDGKAEILWCCVLSNALLPTYGKIHFENDRTGYTSLKNCQVGEKYNPEDVYHGFTIYAGETRLILETFVSVGKTLKYPDMTLCTSVSIGKKLKLLFNNPRAKITNDQTSLYFINVIVFTPRAGLFDETPPS